LRSAVASAPGKVILYGEHFVVKGSRSLVASISLRARVRTRESTGRIVRVRSPQVGIDSWIDLGSLEAGDPRLAPLARILEVLSGMGYSLVPHDAVVESEIPVGAGLGSSASTAVAYALAYTGMLGDPLSRDDLIRVSYEAEKVTHGRPSGVDNTIAVVGGGLVYRRGEGFRHVDLRLPHGTTLLVVDTGVGRSTRDVVQHVLSVAESTWEASRHIYEAADRIVGLALDAFERGDAVLLGRLMNLNQGLLNAVGASSRIIEDIVFEARGAGALGAKLTGAGWGGAVIVLVREEDAERVVGSVGGLARRVFRVGLGGRGAVLESHSV